MLASESVSDRGLDHEAAIRLMAEALPLAGRRRSRFLPTHGHLTPRHTIY